MAPAHITGHIVHGKGGHRLDPGIGPGGGNSHAGQSADAHGPDPLPVHIVQQANVVHSGAVILGEDVRGGGVADLAAALSAKGRVEGQGHKPHRGELLGVEASRLLLHRAEGPCHDNGGVLLRGISLWQIEVARQLNAETVSETDRLHLNVGINFECAGFLIFHDQILLTIRFIWQIR